MKNRYSIMLFCLALLMGFALPTSAAEKRRVEVKPRTAVQSAEHRIALVIGNSNYRIGPLRNPANDARAIAAALRELGFEVDEQINLSYQDMGRAVNRFGKSIRRDSVALFYYAGHGLQVQGSNYLVPVDMEIQDEGEVQFNTVNAGQVLAKMEEAKNPVNIVILDACRDNPYARGWKRSSASRGLAPMDAPVGSFVAYAAAPGKTADDGKGENGLYTESLVRQIKTPAMKIEDVFKRVRTEVRTKSGGSQVPEERSSLEGDFYFARGSMVVEELPPPAVQAPATGQLTVKSNVGGAKVYIDGAYEGEEPVSATLKPATYSIILKKAGYPDATEDVRVEAGGAKTISIVMEKPVLPTPKIEPALRPATAIIDNSFTSPTLGAKFSLIPAGTFMMGSPSGFFSGESGRSPDETQHTVTISRPFYMQTTEVTQGQWKKVMGSNPSYFNSCGNNCPVENVSWNDVQDFIRKLNSTEGMDRYGLPTEAQWEYAARAGTTTRFHTGNGENDLSLAGWYSGNSGSETHPVGQKTPNGWGLYDMHGNVWEWVQDSKRDYSAGSITDPKGPSLGSIRVYRGGSWVNDARNCRSAFRYYENPGALDRHLGFRLLMTVAASDSPSIDKSTSVSGAIETGRDGYFIAYNNGTVSDTRTNLMWAAKDNEADINWANAKSYCENYRGGGYTDWRMPTQEELAGLYDKAKTYESECGYDAHLTELIRLTCVAPWASDTRNRLFSSDAAFFGFGTGGRYWGPQSDGKGRALPVRFGK
jgi:formylglycine-generating enzyme required for sulfatase activity